MSDENDVNELMETEGNIDQINRRAFVRVLGTTGIGAAASSLTGIASAQSDVDGEREPLSGRERGDVIRSIRTNDEAKQILRALQQSGWHPRFNEGKYVSVDDDKNRYAVIPLRNNRVGDDHEAYLLWVRGSPDGDDAPRIAGYRKIESGDRYRYITTRVIDGEATHTTPEEAENNEQSNEEPEASEQVGTQDYTRPPSGGCDTCLNPRSECDDLNFGCFIEIIGYAVSLSAFIPGAAVCLSNLSLSVTACRAALGALLTGSYINVLCEDGFYQEYRTTGYVCAPQEAGYCYPP
jgi:hypothetical protein